MVQAGVITPGQLRLSDVFPSNSSALAEKLPGAQICPSNAAAAQDAQTVLLCVKPNELISVIREIASVKSDLLVISIAAGVKLAKMEEACAGAHRLIRVMPNTPALVGYGASAFSLGSRATEMDAQTVTTMLEAVGLCTAVPEKLMDAVTGLSGSGPAYVYTIIEALADGGLQQGLSKEQALKLAAQTVLGAAQMVLQTGSHPAVLRDQVTSPGGTTIAGLATLERGALRASLMQAVAAATERSRELGA
jgi:pyrroline-5-carboxylate reductase